MELFDLRYFLAAADSESVRAGAEAVAISPSAVSKSILRLEAELGVRLFAREGRRVRLTEEGRNLQKKARSLLQLERDARLAIANSGTRIVVRVAGPEILLATFGVDLLRATRRAVGGVEMDFIALGDEEAAQWVSDRRADACLLSRRLKSGSSLVSRVIARTGFGTFVGARHPLASRAGGPISVRQVLEHDFVSPAVSVFGEVDSRSTDGWRDDKFRRKIAFRCAGLKALERLVVSGLAVGYLPEYFARDLKVARLRITGCPYSCEQAISLAHARSLSPKLAEVFRGDFSAER